MQINFSLAKKLLKTPLLALVILLIVWFSLERFWIADITYQKQAQLNLEREKTLALQEIRRLTQEEDLIAQYLPSFNKIDETWFKPLDKAAFIDKINFWAKTYLATNLSIGFVDNLEINKENFNLKSNQGYLVNLLSISIKLKLYLDTDFLLLQKLIFQELGFNFILEGCNLERSSFNNLSKLNRLEEPSFSVECQLVYLHLTPRSKEALL